MANDFNVLDSVGSTRTKAAIDLGSGRLADETVASGPIPNGVAPTRNPILGSAGIDFTGRVQTQTVAQIHSANFTRVPSTAYSGFSSGAAQFSTPSGLLNNQTETGGNNTPNLGISSGATQFSVPIVTTLTGAIAANAVSLVLPTLKFVSRGVNAWVKAGSTLVLEPNTANEERVTVTAVNYGTNTCTISGSNVTSPYGTALAHNNAVAVIGEAFYTAQSSAVSDGVSPGGMPASSAFFWNQGLNAGVGGMEIERSFLGELNGATGAGGAMAAEFEDTAGGPPLASGMTSGLRLFAAQSLNGKGYGTFTITATAAGATSIVFANAAATNMIPPGHAIILTGSGTAETVFTKNDGSYVPGAGATVGLISPVVNANQTTASFDMFSATGPGLNGFTPHGIGIEEEALYDPVSGKYYIERASTQENMPPQNVVAESPVLWNGAGFDRQKKPNAVQRLLSSAATTNSTVAKSTPGDIFKITGNNTAAAKKYLKLYNKATSPTVGTDTPVATFVIMPSGPFTMDFAEPLYFSNGISFAITGAAPDADTTSIVAGDIECMNLVFA